MVVHKRVQSQYLLFPPIKEITQFAGLTFVSDEKMFLHCLKTEKLFNVFHFGFCFSGQ